MIECPDISSPKRVLTDGGDSLDSGRQVKHNAIIIRMVIYGNRMVIFTQESEINLSGATKRRAMRLMGPRGTLLPTPSIIIHQSEISSGHLIVFNPSESHGAQPQEKDSPQTRGFPLTTILTAEHCKFKLFAGRLAKYRGTMCWLNNEIASLTSNERNLTILSYKIR